MLEEPWKESTHNYLPWIRRGTNLAIIVPLWRVVGKSHIYPVFRMLTVTGHCRRRKIRCITANDDTTGRCQNCIRLKKDCQFFPVDQQGLSPGTRPGQDSRNEDNVNEGRGESVSSSSPRVLTSSTLEQIRNANGQVGTPPLTDDGSGYRSFGGAGSTHGPLLQEF